MTRWFLLLVQISYISSKPTQDEAASQLERLKLKPSHIHKLVEYAELREEENKLPFEVRKYSSIKSPLQKPAKLSLSVGASQKDEASQNSKGVFGQLLHEGDILLTERQLERRMKNRQKRGAIAAIDPQVRWDPRYPINYYIDPTAGFSDSMIQFMKRGFQYWMSLTCANFVENRNGRKPVLKILRGDACSSQIGRDPDNAEQILTMSSTCSYGNFIHELGHLFGLIHTQNRGDRADYVTLVTENMDPRRKFNYDLEDPWDNASVSYDFASIMQYAENTYAIDPKKPVVIAKDWTKQRWMGQREMIQFSDAKAVNYLLQCNKLCTRLPPCQNGGFVNSKDCVSCICPIYFSGAYCQTVAKPVALFHDNKCPPNNVWLTEDFMKLTLLVGDTSEDNSERNITSECTVIVTSQPGTHVQLQVLSAGNMVSTICDKNGVEVNNGNFEIRGTKLCVGDEAKDVTITSIDNRMAIRIWSKRWFSEVVLNIRYVQANQ